mmetsp:Transcript_5677/g.7888  ORF Transcript_5677/g.7888 Transcript_5677/m.7888 type:complete len:135 (+) Transcript_5677:554-958(+)
MFVGLVLSLGESKFVGLFLFSKFPAEVNYVSVFPDVANISSRLTDSQKSTIFMYFAVYEMQMDISKAVTIPDDILLKNKLVNWRDLIVTHFEFVGTVLCQRNWELQSAYPDVDYSARDIIKALSELHCGTSQGF